MGSSVLVPVRGTVRPACLMVSGVKEVVKGGCEVSVSILRARGNHFPGVQRAAGGGGAGEMSGCEGERHFEKEISDPQAKLFTMPLLFTGNLLRALRASHRCRQHRLWWSLAPGAARLFVLKGGRGPLGAVSSGRCSPSSLHPVVTSPHV